MVLVVVVLQLTNNRGEKVVGLLVGTVVLQLTNNRGAVGRKSLIVLQLPNNREDMEKGMVLQLVNDHEGLGAKEMPILGLPMRALFVLLLLSLVRARVSEFKRAKMRLMSAT